MGRLIDATRLRTEVDLLLEKRLISPPTMAMLHNLIDAQPTVFDVKTVVKELENKSTFYFIAANYASENVGVIETEKMLFAMDAIDEAIEIVRRGGANEK